jgi:hypothetical protein
LKRTVWGQGLIVDSCDTTLGCLVVREAEASGTRKVNVTDEEQQAILRYLIKQRVLRTTFGSNMGFQPSTRGGCLVVLGLLLKVDKFLCQSSDLSERRCRRTTKAPTLAAKRPLGLQEAKEMQPEVMSAPGHPR